MGPVPDAREVTEAVWARVIVPRALHQLSADRHVDSKLKHAEV